MEHIIAGVQRALQENIDEDTAKNGRRAFKEEIRIYGVRTADVHRIARESFASLRGMSKNDIFSLCEELWRSGYNEEAFIACDWSYYVSKNYEPSDFEVFEKWVNRYVTNWAACDTLCNHTVGDFIEQYPGHVERLKRWARSGNRWTRRAAAVTLIIPARKGLFLKDIFEIADILLEDTDDLVRKGYGWMLKAASESHRDKVFEYVLSNKTVMPRTALRYAIEKMPPEMKAKAMER